MRRINIVLMNAELMNAELMNVEFIIVELIDFMSYFKELNKYDYYHETRCERSGPLEKGENWFPSK